LRDKTIVSYRRALYRVAVNLARCKDDLMPDELKQYLAAALLEQYSWSTIKVDLSSLQLFHRYGLEREMEWIKIIQPPREHSLPQIHTREELHRLINTVRKLRYRIFRLVVYSLGLQISQGLPWLSATHLSWAA
jgi:site-specific recombinase XerD